MTFLSELKLIFKDTGTELEKFEKAFVTVLKKEPTELQAVQGFVGEVAPVIEAAVALADPVAEAPVAAALSMVEVGLAAIQKAVSDTANAAGVVPALQAFAADVPQVLSGVAVKDAGLQSKITALVNFVTNETKVLLPAVEAWVAQIKG